MLHNIGERILGCSLTGPVTVDQQLETMATKFWNGDPDHEKRQQDTNELCRLPVDNLMLTADSVDQLLVRY